MGRRSSIPFICVVFALMLCAAAARADVSGALTAPSYSAASIVHAADQTAGVLAPNAIATIYGTNLAFTTHALSAADMSHGNLPLSLAEVTVYVNNIPASLFYVSPNQINFLVPYEITTSSAVLFVTRQGLDGPFVQIQLAPAAPAFFQWNGNLAVAEHANGTLVSPTAPAQAGEVIVLFAAGLGRTAPDISSGFVAQLPYTILYAQQLQVLLNGAPCPAGNIYYAGITPGFAGLYQINLKLPDPIPQNPEIRLRIGAQISPAGIQLPAQ
ncbi:MAG TPA: hypothetical protein VG273_20820 [Bryobacteraceae bacterium]|jgi:uncharacterized protein (TIGR03437 family)|nr:hypothetical protein [Bryobacteraceae bacterium]